MNIRHGLPVYQQILGLEISVEETTRVTEIDPLQHLPAKALIGEETKSPRSLTNNRLSVHLYLDVSRCEAGGRGSVDIFFEILLQELKYQQELAVLAHHIQQPGS